MALANLLRHDDMSQNNFCCEPQTSKSFPNFTMNNMFCLMLPDKHHPGFLPSLPFSLCLLSSAYLLSTG